jgi:hypothetical protein
MMEESGVCSRQPLRGFKRETSSDLNMSLAIVHAGYREPNASTFIHRIHLQLVRARRRSLDAKR